MELESLLPAQNRAKLYLLDDGNEWLDQGTGYPIIEQNSVILTNLFWLDFFK